MIDHVEEFAPAKVNLCLHVTGRREDGYHLLDSLVVFAAVGDSLHLTRANSHFLEITGPFGRSLEPEDDNLVFRAAEKLGDLAPSAAISLHKALPVAAGIGGGSADAAAALRGLLALSGKTAADVSDLDDIALELGADVPACLRSTALRMTGIGEKISTISPFPDVPAVLINPGVPVPTGPIFKALNLKQSDEGGAGLGALPHPGFASQTELVAWLQDQRNDLQGPAIALVPQVGEVLNALKTSEDCRLARMSGSGATCFGLFETSHHAEAFAAKLNAQKPDWWVVSTVLR